ncbi:SusC/RagA family TonB-linked outer membrane protein [Solitalea canadensis]|nr:SusC/RagA family TonB-linked outer membrane protein [Solitalea canadensis]
MKLSFLLILIATMQLSANVYSQTGNISLKLKNADLETALHKIQRNSSYSFFYSVDDINSTKTVSIDVKDEPLEQVLTTLLSPYHLSYTVQNNLIVLKRSTETSITVNETEKNAVNRIIKGKVTSKDDGQSLPGVSVFLKEKPSVGVSTDGNGLFQLSIPDDAKTLVFSMAGFQKQEIAIGSKSEFNISLATEVTQLKDVVVTGYQNMNKRTFTGSVGKISSDRIKELAMPDVGKMLQGQVAGVSVENTSGTFGSKAKIRIRGSSSIIGNKEPLWVVDGVVLDDIVNVNPNQLYSGDANNLLSSAISGLNPNDIEDIQFLKDASATAMYGTQAVNGVIVITTKKGKKGDISINYRNNTTLSMIPSILDFNVMNSKERLEFSEELYAKNQINLVSMNNSYGAFGKLYTQWARKDITDDRYNQLMREYKMQNTDWFKELFHNSITQEHSLSFSSGNDQAQYYTSLSFYKDNGQTEGQNTNRYTGNIKANYNINKKLQITTTLFGSSRDQKVFGAANASSDNGVVSREYDLNPYSYAMSTSRAMRPYDKTGDLEYYLSNYAPFNIIHELQNNFFNMKTREIKVQGDLEYKVLKNLNFNSLVSGRLTTAASDHIVTELSNTAQAYRAMDNNDIRNSNPYLYNDPNDDDQYPISVMPRGGLLYMNETQGTFYTFRNSFNWKPTIGTEHAFNILVGTEVRHRKYESSTTNGYGYEYYRGKVASPDYRAVQRDLLAGGSYYSANQSINNEFSWFVNSDYTLHDRYNFSASLRSDGSNKMGKSQRFKFFPTWQLSAAWNIDKENFLEQATWINLLKLRTSYGLRGNVNNIGSSEMLVYYGKTNRFDNEANESTLNIASPDNPDLKWEKEHAYNVGLDFGFFNRLTGTIEYYDRENFDLIGTVPSSYVTGYVQKVVNWASMRNSGFEVTLNYRASIVKDLSWNAIVTWGYNKNKVLDAYFNQTVMQATGDAGSAMIGRPLNGLYSFQFAGLSNEGLPTFYDKDGNVTTLINKYETSTGTLKYEGSRDPLGSGGITNSFKYKSLSLSVLFTYAYGNKIRLLPFYAPYYDDATALSKDLASRWTTPGDEQYTTIPRILDQETYDYWRLKNADPIANYNRSDIRVANGSFIRLKNISLSYALPSYVLKRIGVKSASLQALAQNIYVWADQKLKGQDPEALVSGTSVPLPKTVSLGLSVDF